MSYITCKTVSFAYENQMWYPALISGERRRLPVYHRRERHRENNADQGPSGIEKTGGPVLWWGQNRNSPMDRRSRYDDQRADFPDIEKKNGFRRNISQSRRGSPRVRSATGSGKKTNPASDKILAICDVLELTPYELLEGAEGEREQKKRLHHD